MERLSDGSTSSGEPEGAALLPIANSTSVFSRQRENLWVYWVQSNKQNQGSDVVPHQTTRSEGREGSRRGTQQRTTGGLINPLDAEDIAIRWR